MALFNRLRTPTSRSRQITLWVVGALLFLQLLAVLSTWHCSGPGHRANQRKGPFSALLLQLSGHGMCEGEPEASSFPFEGVLGRRHTVRRQRPYAYAFCLTSVHHLCTALLNVVRLRKLRSFQASCLTSLSPSHCICFYTEESVMHQCMTGCRGQAMRYNVLCYVTAVLTYNLSLCLPSQILHAQGMQADFNIKVQ